MAHFSPALPRDRVRHPVRIPVDRHGESGMTGMGPNTRRHFANVQQKMMNYVDQQDDWPYDEYYDEAPNPHHQLHQPPSLDCARPPPVDGKRVTSTTSMHPHSRNTHHHHHPDHHHHHSTHSRHSLPKDLHVKPTLQGNPHFKTTSNELAPK